MNEKVIAIIATVVIHGGIVGGFAAAGGSEEESIYERSVVIEASLKRKSTTKKQPTKAPPKPKQPPRTAATDPVAPPKKPDPKKVKPDEDVDKELEEALKNIKNQSQQPDDSEGDPDDPTVPGDFDGSKHGWADEDKGDPYFRQLVADAYEGWELPTLETAKKDAAGCVRISSDGKIVAVKLCKPSGNTNIDRSVTVALQRLKDKRNEEPVPIPAHLMREVTTQWRNIPFPLNQ